MGKIFRCLFYSTICLNVILEFEGSNSFGVLTGIKSVQNWFTPPKPGKSKYSPDVTNLLPEQMLKNMVNSNTKLLN